MVKTMAKSPYAYKLAKHVAGGAIGAYAPYAKVAYTGAKVAYNGYKAYTRTAPKQVYKKKQTIPDDGNQGHTLSFSKGGKRTIKKLSKTQQALKDALPQITRRSNNTTIISAIGQQTFNGIGDTFWNSTDLDNVASPSPINQKRFWVENVSVKCLLTNFTTTPSQLVIYEVSTKDDCSETPDARVSAGLDMKYGVTLVSKTPYINPTESTLFTKQYKIDTQTSVTLSPGETHIHNAFWSIQKYYLSSQQATDPGLFRKPFTKHIMIRLMGSPVTNGTTVTIGSAKIGIMTFARLSYKVPQGSISNLVVSNLGTVPPTSISASNTVNEETGLTQANITL